MPTDKGYRNTYSSPTRRTGPTKTGSGSSKRSWQRVGGPAPTYDREFRAAIAGNPNIAYNERAYNSFANTYGAGAGALGIRSPGSPGSPGGGSSGRYGYGRGGGGGGGGGGAAGMTQAMFDQMVAALSQRGPQLQAQQVALPAFQGQNVAAFNPAAFNQAQTALSTAARNDRNAVAQNAQQTTQALNTNFTNDYANAQVTPGATQAPVAGNLQATAGPVLNNDPNAQAAAGVNAANGDSQAAFANLLKVLAGAANQSQASRLSQVQMDRGTANNAINAQATGLGAGINMARTQAQQQWAQQDAERRYQNSLMAQQWQRESLTRNQDLANQVAQANWAQRNTQLAAQLQPILDLIAGSRGVKLDALTKMLSGAA